MHSTRRLAALVLVAAGALSLTASPALAESLSGKTKQGRAVSMETDATGQAVSMAIDWSAKCDHGRYRSGSRVTFKTPHVGSFKTIGTIKSREGQFRFTTNVKLVGTETKPLPGATWAGNFRAVVIVKQKKRKIDRCRTPRIGWQVGPAA